MKKYFLRMLAACASTAIAACSGGSGSTPPIVPLARRDVAALNAVATFSHANHVRNGPSMKVSLAAEYANFSKGCAPQTSVIGAIHYPRKLKKFSRGTEIIPLQMGNRDDKACPLYLVSIQAEIVDNAGLQVASAATTYDLSKMGREEFSCYNAVGGPGYCLVNSALSARAREVSRSRLVGTINIKWRY